MAIIHLNYNGEISYNTTIDEVVRRIFKVLAITVDEFLDFEYEGVTNRKRVFDSYSITEKIKYGFLDYNGTELRNFSFIRSNMRCPFTVFYIDSKYVTIDVIISNSNVLTDNYISTIFSQEDEELGEGNSGQLFTINNFFQNYVKSIPKILKTTPLENINITKTSRRQYVNPKVWLWSKSLCENQKFNNNSIFDLTPFVQSINSFVGDNGGNFSLNLLNIEGVIQVENKQAVGIWHPKKERYLKFKTNYSNKINYIFKNVINARYNRNFYDNTINEIVDEKNEESENIENENTIRLEELKIISKSVEQNLSGDIFFKNLISENDLIFITFRDDEENEVDKIDDFFISNDKLPGNNWDMIGLIDKNSLSLTYESNDYVTNITGRDLMKLLIEDGSYFFANSFSDENVNGIFENIDLPNRGDSVNSSNQVINNGQRAANRLITNGIIDTMYIPEARNIHFVMNMLISALSNIEICPTELFSYYEDRVTKFQIPIYETLKWEDYKKKKEEERLQEESKL